MHQRQRADENVLTLARNKAGDAHDDRTVPAELGAPALTIGTVAGVELVRIDTRGQMEHPRGDPHPEGPPQPPTHVLAEIGHHIEVATDAAQQRDTPRDGGPPGLVTVGHRHLPGGPIPQPAREQPEGGCRAEQDPIACVLRHQGTGASQDRAGREHGAGVLADDRVRQGRVVLRRPLPR